MGLYRAYHLQGPLPPPPPSKHTLSIHCNFLTMRKGGGGCFSSSCQIVTKSHSEVFRSRLDSILVSPTFPAPLFCLHSAALWFHVVGLQPRMITYHRSIRSILCSVLELPLSPCCGSVQQTPSYLCLFIEFKIQRNSTSPHRGMVLKSNRLCVFFLSVTCSVSINWYT